MFRTEHRRFGNDRDRQRSSLGACHPTAGHLCDDPVVRSSARRPLTCTTRRRRGCRQKPSTSLIAGPGGDPIYRRAPCTAADRIACRPLIGSEHQVEKIGQRLRSACRSDATLGFKHSKWAFSDATDPGPTCCCKTAVIAWLVSGCRPGSRPSTWRTRPTVSPPSLARARGPTRRSLIWFRASSAAAAPVTRGRSSTANGLLRRRQCLSYG